MEKKKSVKSQHVTRSSQQTLLPGEPLNFSVPEKLLRLARRPKPVVGNEVASDPSAPLLLGGGTFVCEYRNGQADVREFFAQLGWPQAPAPSQADLCNSKGGCCPANRHWNCGCVLAAVASMPDFTFYWGNLSSTAFALCHAASMQTGRPMVMNRIPWVTLISNKSQLATTCIGHRHTRDGVCLQSHVPATFVVGRDTDPNTLPSLARRLLAMHPVWIVKPYNYAKGEGIQLAFREDGEDAMLKTLVGDRWGAGKVVQCYMTDPMLLAKKKFDLRIFLLLVTTGKGLVAFYHQGYVRLALNDFLMRDRLHMDTHLTNQAVQAKQSGYEANKEDTTWTVQQMNEHLNSHSGGEFGSDWTLKRLHPAVKGMVTTLVEALVQRVQRERRLQQPGKRDRYPCRNTFNLLGLDVLIDSSGKPWLIEANADPALSRQTRTLELLLPSITAEAFGLAAEVISKSHGAVRTDWDSENALKSLDFLQNFQPIGYYEVLDNQL